MNDATLDDPDLYQPPPSDCSICGLPIQSTTAGWLHVAPAMSLGSELGSAEYAAGQVAVGYDLARWVLETSGHRAEL